MSMPALKHRQIHQALYNFVNTEVLPLVNIDVNNFWHHFEQILTDFTPRNQALLQKRRHLQQQIDAWHQQNKGTPVSTQTYQDFLVNIGYIANLPEDFEITTDRVDDEIAKIAGPQLVVPIDNARFALNAANARWGSLYDALYGTDVIDNGEKNTSKTDDYDAKRGESVIAYGKAFLDEHFALSEGSHKNVKNYVVYYHHLLAFFEDGTQSGLKEPSQFVALSGHKCAPDSIVLKNNGLHIEIVIDRSASIGGQDITGIQDIRLESAISTIMDFEDSVAAVDGEDKVNAYRNWLGLMKGDLSASFNKNGKQETRELQPDLCFTDVDGEDYLLPGRSLMLVRNVGHLMESDLSQDEDGQFAPEGVIDGIMTSLIAVLDLQKSNGLKNSRTGSAYIVKPKMHGPEEVRFTCDLFARIEQMLGLAKNTLKLGIMDEERRTSVNLKACMFEARERLVFINTGFLDRTGDEIHTSMQAGPVMPKNDIKQAPWIEAYETNNAESGIDCGLVGKAQIGKGMWAMPDEMYAMMQQKTAHLIAGASTAWVPSPTAATLHAMHYHQISVSAQQQKMTERLSQYQNNPSEQHDYQVSQLRRLLTPPLLNDRQLSQAEVECELANNIQGILGYVSRWVQLGIGCSKVPDINNIGLMEDRATLRISSQHIANWLMHGICSKQQIEKTLQAMAKVVDEQNAGTAGYQAMSENFAQSFAYQAAQELILEGHQQPSGYTEPLLHYYRRLAKESISS
ncbi:malate synthase G [Glaciecola petra]|uniref:Malate synthase G n=1 Tax=Glaciecola petra TaxID=3075602 RepID=A0ABU2ZQA0_9ALTE|nr:malate synthase G [Aestuariibacter sp. P117]MDT0594810.1 malate synthase G [Aestuariibacter sp. P117]